MTIIKCENCGKMKSKEYIKEFKIGKELFFVCKECYEICNKFKDIIFPHRQIIH